jgi:hypothetical protein
MSEGRELRCYDYVNHPYAAVRDVLRADPMGIFRGATTRAAERANELWAELHVSVAGVNLGADVDIRVLEVQEETPRLGSPILKLTLEWQAAKNPGLFPEMKAVLSVYALSRSETQLDFEGRYRVPFGPLGGAVDALVGYRVAEASVLRFVQEVAAYLRGDASPVQKPTSQKS